MARDTDTAAPGNGPSPAVVDRIMIGACAGIWFVVLGVGVAATVALINLGRGHTRPTVEPSTPWLLYTVIGVSALAILAAIPLLLHARRTSTYPAAPNPAESDPAAPNTSPSSNPLSGQAGGAGLSAPRRGPEAATEKLRFFGTIADPVERKAADSARPAAQAGPIWAAEESVNRLWLRCTVALAGAIGAALIGVGAATSTMAAGHDDPAWVVYGVAGLITIAMPAIPWFYLREIHRTVGAAAAG